VTTEQRVYTGAHPVVFMTGGVGPVEPGAEFTVPKELAGRFDARADVARPRKRKPPRTGTAADAGQPDGGQETEQDTPSPDRAE
jgi:hypothetical protein